MLVRSRDHAPSPPTNTYASYIIRLHDTILVPPQINETLTLSVNRIERKGNYLSLETNSSWNGWNCPVPRSARETRLGRKAGHNLHSPTNSASTIHALTDCSGVPESTLALQCIVHIGRGGRDGIDKAIIHRAPVVQVGEC